jgi:hypothetical protein
MMFFTKKVIELGLTLLVVFFCIWFIAVILTMAVYMWKITANLIRKLFRKGGEHNEQ